jgi:DMSO/TMAO reductase YedYZ molybdopterin-dependent catalytic subunit/thiosulfate reductase cytochrome b subunit
MISFDAPHQAVHDPPDRRFRVRLKPSVVGAVLVLAAVPVLLAWVQGAVFGLPYIRPVLPYSESAASGPHGFPAWVRYCHFFNFLFLTMLIRSGLSILMDHPRLYFNNHCTPGTEWIRLSPLSVPRDRIWTAKDDARYISPLAALPGYRHTIGIARSWHFLNVYGFIITGLIFVSLLFSTTQWRRLVPTSETAFVQAWSTFVHYANFHFPPEPNGYYGYNALQQLTYFGMVFVMGPLSIATGLAMSPALVNHFSRFGGRQTARSIHFVAMLGYVVFIIAHVTLVALTGFMRNINHIVVGTDDRGPLGMILGFVGIGVVLLCWVVAHYVSWKHPRSLQHMQRAISLPLLLATFNRVETQQRYRIDEVSSHFWPNGKMPVRDDWKRLAADHFREYRLQVGGLVENPIELSLAELEALGVEESVTMHHCIQGWTGIAQWKGVPMKKLVDLVKPTAAAHTVVFFSFGEGLYGGGYYETQRLEDVLQPQCLLAFEMNRRPLPEVYGAPLRLRVENQLGYKMVKWVERIEFIESEKQVGEGEGGKNEDDEYFDLLPNI